MKIAARVLLLVVVFAGVGLLTGWLVLRGAPVRYGAHEPGAQLAAAAAGLFAGGAAAVLVGIGMALRPRD